MHWVRRIIRRKHIPLRTGILFVLICLYPPYTQAQVTSIWERQMGEELAIAENLLHKEKAPRQALAALEAIPRFFPLISDSILASESRIKHATLSLSALSEAQVACDSLLPKIEKILGTAGIGYRPGSYQKQEFWEENLSLLRGEEKTANGLFAQFLTAFDYCEENQLPFYWLVGQAIWKRKIDESWDLPFWSNPADSPTPETGQAASYYRDWLQQMLTRELAKESPDEKLLYSLLEEYEERIRKSQLRWLNWEDVYPQRNNPLPQLRANIFSADSLEARIKRDVSVLKADSLGLLQDLLRDQRQSIQAQIKGIERQAPQFVSFWQASSPPVIDSLQAHLNESEALIRYFAIERSLFILVIEKNRLNYLCTELTVGAVDNLWKLQFEMMQAPGPSVTGVMNLGLENYQNFLSPVDSLIGKGIKDLIIVFPRNFPTNMEVFLERKPGLQDLFPDWPFLIKRFSFRYASTCAQWLEAVTHSKGDKPERYGGMSWDPQLDQDGDSSIVWSEMQAGGKIQFTGLQNDLVGLGRSFAGDLFLGPEATRDNFFRVANQYKVLHLALPWKEETLSHSWDWANQFSGPGERRLPLRTISGLQLSNDLIVYAPFYVGPPVDEPNNPLYPHFNSYLYEAFHQGGAQAVLNSKWEFPDASRQSILQRYFAYLQEGFGKAEALQRAQVDYIQNVDGPEWAHPYYWASFSLYGDNGSVHLADENHDLQPILLGLGVLVLLVLLLHQMSLWIRARRRK